jgi:hypothetical protein
LELLAILLLRRDLVGTEHEQEQPPAEYER